LHPKREHHSPCPVLFQQIPLNQNQNQNQNHQNPIKHKKNKILKNLKESTISCLIRVPVLRSLNVKPHHPPLRVSQGTDGRLNLA
jgi:hypothetical protein